MLGFGFGGVFLLLLFFGIVLTWRYYNINNINNLKGLGYGDFKTFLPRPYLARKFRKCGLKLVTVPNPKSNSVIIEGNETRTCGNHQKTATFTRNGYLM